ncbi:permease [Rhodonellum psychrophilum GCM71 = DSM 17998]|uniref:Permease n=2 Tax=Rhodonellum TaxID=336827 RepID=U5C0Z4_9BACT|nr:MULTISPECIES: AI-2E family transporter [Rhodonellum]ERM83748.1 permease [Rhodonellum psychrophilum GCM71 = DSM 17998]MDO9553168.1 AI-2E family transporter [Rhodonellum sp.]SDY89151.1 Predicted PurR-regulated permease PerM [Rhodonellum ikkaensis]
MQKLIIYVLIFIILFLLVGWYFSNITLYFIFSLVIAAVLRPLTNRINSIHLLGRHVPRWIAVLFSYGAIFLVLFSIGLMFIPLISAQINLIASYDLDFLYEQIQNPVGRIEDLLIRYEIVKSEPGFLITQVRENLITNLNIINLQGFINSVLNTTSSFLIAILAIGFITFFLLLENGLLRRNILNLIPNAYFEISVSTFNIVEKLLSNYLVGLLIQMTSIFSMASIGLTILEVEYALTIAVFAAVANLIPYAGPLLGATFGVLVGLSTAEFANPNEIYFFLFKILSVFSVVQIMDNIILQPLIFSKSVKAHPLEIFVIIFAGAKIAGVLGMIFAIPIYTIFRVSFLEFYRGYREYKIFKI